MAYPNMLSICVLLAALAAGDCFLSNLMNEPLNFAVSLLDGRGAQSASSSNSLPSYSAKTSSEINIVPLPQHRGPTPKPAGGRAHGRPDHIEILTNNVAVVKGATGSRKQKLPAVKAIRYESDGDSNPTSASEELGYNSSESTEKDGSSGELVVVNAKSNKHWKHSSPGSNGMAAYGSSKKARNHRIRASFSKGRGRSSKAYSPLKKGYNKRISASFSNGRGHSQGHVHVHPLKGGQKFRQSGWRKSWGVDRSGGSGEKEELHGITVQPESVDGSSEEYILIKKTARPSRRTLKIRHSNKGYGILGPGGFVKPNRKFSRSFRANRPCKASPLYSY